MHYKKEKIANRRLPLSVTTPENTIYNGAVTGCDADGDSLLYSVKTQASKGAVVIDEATGSYTYTPNTNVVGNDTLFAILGAVGATIVLAGVAMKMFAISMAKKSK